jgi:gluconate 2-dehydrogenase gamma chain
MDRDKAPLADRRGFLRDAGIVAVSLPVVVVSGHAGAASAASMPTAAGNAPQGTPTPRSTAASAGYQTLSLEEATFTETLVDHMWPKDQLSASGSELGIATFIDRQLAGAFGQGDRLYLQGPFRKGKPQHGYQLPLTPMEYYKAGMAAASVACRKRFSRSLDKLEPAEREQFLKDLAGGKVAEGPLNRAEWFNGLVYPLFERGAFADPIYGGNRDKAAWKMIGYPGLPSAYGQDVVRFRGKPHPRATIPQSIQDLS